jgi:hypothetical protein
VFQPRLFQPQLLFQAEPTSTPVPNASAPTAAVVKMVELS